MKSGNAPVRMGVLVDGKVAKGFSVLSPVGKERVFQAPIKATKGPKTVAAAFLNPFSDPRALDPAKKDRKLRVETNLEIYWDAFAWATAPAVSPVAM